MIKVTDWFWKLDVKSPYLIKQGWQTYQVVDHGGSFSVSLAKTDGALKQVEPIAAKIESFDRAIELIEEYDSDMQNGRLNLIVIAIAVIMIPVSVWLIAELT
jgi:hypothetical protein